MPSTTTNSSSSSGNSSMSQSSTGLADSSTAPRCTPASRRPTTPTRISTRPTAAPNISRPARPTRCYASCKPQSCRQQSCKPQPATDPLSGTTRRRPKLPLHPQATKAPAKTMAKSPLSTYKFLLLFISWWAIWAFLQVSLLIGFGLPTAIALSDSIVSNTFVALSCGFLSNNMQYYLPKKERYWYILFISLGLSGIILLACKAILVPLLSDRADGAGYAQFFSKSWAVRFDIVFLQVARSEE